MAYSIRAKRNIELSTIYYLKAQIDADWDDVTTLLGFPNAEQAEVPIVTIELTDTDSVRKELGSTTLYKDFTIVVDIFGKSEANRLDLASFILDKLADGYAYYTHAYNSDHSYDRTAAGYVTLISVITDTKIAALDTVSSKEKYRHNITVTVRNNQ